MESKALKLPERIDIYVPQDVATTIRNDAALFGYYGEVGIETVMNRFLTDLIINYRSAYVEEYDKKLSQIHDILSPLAWQDKEVSDLAKAVPEEKTSELAKTILEKVVFPEYTSNSRKNIIRLRLNQTNRLKEYFDGFTYADLKEHAFSRYFRDILISYCRLPRNRRERYIFKETYNKLEKICGEQNPRHWKLMLSNDSDKIHDIIPYCMATGAEEMFNYLLCTEFEQNGKAKAAAFRINRIRKINETSRYEKIPDTIQQNLERTVRLSPQYVFNNDKPIKIRMNQEGQLQYKRIYTGRPMHKPLPKNLDKKSKSILFEFDCSVSQAFFYFRRFPQDTIEIVAPEELKQRMKEFYQKAVRPLGLNAADAPETDYKEHTST